MNLLRRPMTSWRDGLLLLPLLALLTLSGGAQAQINAEDLADNDLKDEAGKEYPFSKASRENYKANHKGKDAADQQRQDLLFRYYLQGEKTPFVISDSIPMDQWNLLRMNTDGKDRARTAKRAVRYVKPLYGYVDNDEFKGPRETSNMADRQNADPRTEEVIGRGIYKKDVPRTDDEIVRSVWRFSRDLLWGKKAKGDIPFPPPAPLPNTIAGRRTWIFLRTSDFFKCDKFIEGNLDMGKRLEGHTYYCIENILFMASLLREVGYLTQFKNTIPSTGTGRFDMQTAALNVWYIKGKAGGWHFFDPWEGFDKNEGYIQRRGIVVGPYHDFKTFKRTRPLMRFDPAEGFQDFGAYATKTFLMDPNYGKLVYPDEWETEKEGKKDGAGARNDPIVRMRLRDSAGRLTGWTGLPAPFSSDAPFLAQIPGSSYFDPDTLVALQMGLDGSPLFAPREEETLFWEFDNLLSETRTYTLQILNPTDLSASYVIDIVPEPVDRTIVLLSPKTPRLEGVLKPGGVREVTLSFFVSAPVLRPPAPVQDVGVTADTQNAALFWTAVAGDVTYTVYRCAGREVPRTLADLADCVVLASGLTTPGFVEPLPAPGDYFYIVTATNRAGESALDSGENSVEALVSGASDVTSAVAVIRGGYNYHRLTGRYLQQVTLRNISDRGLIGPISLVLDNLSANATLFNQSGTTLRFLPAGNPYINAAPNSDTILAPGQSLSVVLEFVNPTQTGILYQTRVLAGAGAR